MNFEDFELEEIPYWCSRCDAPAVDVLELPEPVGVESDPIYEVCESCYNELCEAALETIVNHRLPGETEESWVSRCNEVSVAYGLGAEHDFCVSCGCPRVQDPDCVECREKEVLCEAQDRSVMRSYY